jgi:hypothetical protein
MGDILRKAVEKRHKFLIEKLLAVDEYRQKKEYVVNLSLTDLEREYKDFLMTYKEKQKLIT